MNDQVLKRLQRDHHNPRPLLHVLRQQLERVEANTNPDYVLTEDTLGYPVRNPDQYHYPFKESRFYWFVKKRLLPPFYWNQMLRGREPDIPHRRLKSAGG